MMAVAALLLALSLAILVWFGLQKAQRSWLSYQEKIHAQARSTLDASFMFLDLAQLQPLAIVAGLALVLAAAWILGRWWGVVPVACLLLFAPFYALLQLRRRRAEQFDAQLPDFVLALAGALRAGAALLPALQHIVAQSPAPLTQEFALLLRQQRLGLSLHEALAQLHERMPSESCGLVVSALVVAGQTGGGLADTLENIAYTLRARQHWLGRVKALTAQGKMQSYIMAALPLLLILVLARLEPQAMAKLWQTWYGWLALMVILALEIIGLYWTRRLARVDV